MNRLFAAVSTTVILMFALSACGGTGAPVAPVSDLTGPRVDQSVERSGGRILWGMWHVTLDPDALTADIVPMRSAEVGVNVTRFMAPPVSPINMIHFSFDSGQSDFANGLFVLDVTLNHPFPGLNKYRGFDVRGIFFSNGESALPGDGTLTYAGEADSHMLNPDGFTRWWNSMEFPQPGLFGFTPGKLAPPINPSAILNPYKYFCDDLQAESPMSDVDPVNRGTFGTVPGSNSRRYEIQFKMDGGNPAFDFNYAVDASWEDLGPDASSWEVADFPLAANCNEAWWLELSTVATDLYYVDNVHKGGQLAADVTVHDWQASAAGAYIADQVAGINLHSSLFGTGKLDILSAGAVLISEGTGVGTWHIMLPSSDLNLVTAGDFNMWVEVLSNDPNTYAPQIPGGDTIPHADGPLAAYIEGSVTVSGVAVQKPPTVLEVIPPDGEKGIAAWAVQINGTDFINDGLAVKFDNGSYQIPVSKVTLVSETETTCKLNLTNAELGPYDVTVMVNNVSGPGTFEGTLPDGFEVLATTVRHGWPTMGYNYQRNSLAPVQGPQTSHQAYATPCTAATAPETLLIGVDPDDFNDWLVYIGYYSSTARPFAAYRASDGSQKWSVSPPAPYTFYRLMAVAPPGVPCPNDESGTAYVWAYAGTGLAESIMALSAKNGDVLWTYTPPAPGSWLQLERFGLVDPNGDFIFANAASGGYNLLALNHADGSVKWTVSTGFGQTPDPVISLDGNTIYNMANSSSTIRAYDLTTNPPVEKWNLYLGSYLPSEQQSDPIVASDGSLYVISRVSSLVKVTDQGTSGSVDWATPTYSPSYGAWIQLAEGPDGNIYSLIPSGIYSPSLLYCFDHTNGAVIHQTGIINTDFMTGMAIGSDGLIYLGGIGSIWCYNPDLSEKWNVSANQSRCTDAALLDDGSFFVADIGNGRLYKFHD